VITITKETQVRKGGEPDLVATQGPAYLWETSDGRFFVASEANVIFSGQEILVFPANEEGEIEDWLDVAGGKNCTFAYARRDLLSVLNEEEQ